MNPIFVSVSVWSENPSSFERATLWESDWTEAIIIPHKPIINHMILKRNLDVLNYQHHYTVNFASEMWSGIFSKRQLHRHQFSSSPFFVKCPSVTTPTDAACKTYWSCPTLQQFLQVWRSLLSSSSTSPKASLRWLHAPVVTSEQKAGSSNWLSTQ